MSGVLILSRVLHIIAHCVRGHIVPVMANHQPPSRSSDKPSLTRTGQTSSKSLLVSPLSSTALSASSRSMSMATSCGHAVHVRLS